jgi:hypothetical protein
MSALKHKEAFEDFSVHSNKGVLGDLGPNSTPDYMHNFIDVVTLSFKAKRSRGSY